MEASINFKLWMIKVRHFVEDTRMEFGISKKRAKGTRENNKI